MRLVLYQLYQVAQPVAVHLSVISAATESVLMEKINLIVRRIAAAAMVNVKLWKINIIAHLIAGRPLAPLSIGLAGHHRYQVRTNTTFHPNNVVLG